MLWIVIGVVELSLLIEVIYRGCTGRLIGRGLSKALILLADTLASCKRLKRKQCPLLFWARTIKTV